MSRTRDKTSILKAARLAHALAQLPRLDSTEGAEGPHAIPYGSYFWAAQMAAAVRPLVVRARRQAFGSPEPPCDTADEVNDWLARIYYPAREAPGHEAAQEHGRLRPTAAPAVLRDRKALAAAATVREAAQRIVAWTGWPEIAALGLILLRGYRVPDTFRWRLDGPTPGDVAFEGAERDLEELGGVDFSLLFRRVTLTLRPWHLMRPGFVREVLDTALTALGRVHPRQADRLSDRDLLLMDVVAVTGAMPPSSAGPGHKSGATRYWTQALRQWEAFGGPTCGPAALAKRWERLPPFSKQTLARAMADVETPHQGGDSA